MIGKVGRFGLLVILTAGGCATQSQGVAQLILARPDFVLCLTQHQIDPVKFTDCVAQSSDGDKDGACRQQFIGDDERKLVIEQCAAISDADEQQRQAAYSAAHPTVECDPNVWGGTTCSSN